MAAVESLICGRLLLVVAPEPVFLYSKKRAFFHELLDMSIHGCAVAIVALSTYSLQQLVWMAGLRNSDALAQMRFIHAATTPADSIMDGFTGVGWFRPHASFYWMSAPGPRARIPPEETNRMMAMLGGCGTEPKIVILDEYLNQLSPRFRC